MTTATARATKALAERDSRDRLDTRWTLQGDRLVRVRSGLRRRGVARSWVWMVSPERVGDCAATPGLGIIVVSSLSWRSRDGRAIYPCFYSHAARASHTDRSRDASPRVAAA